jgi:hypothetical protein
MNFLRGDGRNKEGGPRSAPIGWDRGGHSVRTDNLVFVL